MKYSILQQSSKIEKCILSCDTIEQLHNAWIMTSFLRGNEIIRFHAIQFLSELFDIQGELILANQPIDRLKKKRKRRKI